MRLLASPPAILAFALTLGFSGCGGGPDGAETGRQAVARPTVTLSAPTHRPSAGAPWPIAIRAYGPSGRPLRAEVRYRFLFGGRVVARRSHYRFRGTFHDDIRWPARSIGIPLTFRAVVTTPLAIPAAVSAVLPRLRVRLRPIKPIISSVHL